MLADRDLPYTRVPRIERFDADDLADLARLDKHASDDCDRRLLAVAVVLYPSVVRIAVLVAASGTAANARAAGVGACTTRTLLRFYPREDSQLLKASVRIRHLVPMSPLRQVMEEFHQHLGLAKQAHLTAVTESFGTADRVQYAVAAKAWQHAAGRTRAFLVELQKILQLDQVAPSQDEHDSVTCLLTDVEAGRHPMLDGTGDVSLPDAFNRRQTDRVRVCLPAVMITAEGEQSVIVRDLSATGLGLDLARNLAVDTAVVVRVAPLLSLEGVVVWSEIGRAGVRLSVPLTGGNPFYAFCIRPK